MKAFKVTNVLVDDCFAIANGLVTSLNDIEVVIDIRGFEPYLFNRIMEGKYITFTRLKKRFQASYSVCTGTNLKEIKMVRTSDYLITGAEL